MDITIGIIPTFRQIVALSLAVALFAVVGCATVDPKPDFAKTAGLISERTGVEEVYLPGEDEWVAKKVNRLLANGLTTGEAVQVALLNNRAFQSLFQEIGASRADVIQSGLLTNPSLSLLARFPEGGGRSNLTFGFGQELVDLWQIPMRREIAEAHLEQTVLTITRRAVELAAEVKRGCYQVLALERAEGIAKSSIDLVERSLKLAEDRFRAGEIGLVDVDLARADVLTVRRELASLQRDQEVAKAVLGRLIGLSRRRTDWALIDELPRRVAIMGDDDLVLWAMHQRLEARVAALQVQAAEGELRRECLNVVPSVVVGTEWERTERRALPGRKIAADTARDSLRNGQLTAPTIQSRAERNLERRQIIDSLLGPSLEITLPIWDQNQARIAKSRFAVEQKRKEYEYLLDVVAQEVQQAAAAVRGSERLTQMSEEEILPHAQKSIETARRVYRTGQDSIIALIDAQRFLIVQQRSYIDDLRDCATALADLEQAVGGPLPGPDKGISALTTPVTTQPDRGDGSDE